MSAGDRDTLTDEQKYSLSVVRGSESHLFATVEKMLRIARAAAWEECFESGTPWENPYESDD